MRDLNNYSRSYETPYQTQSRVVQFMSTVYLWMSFGITLTGAVAFLVGNSPELMMAIVGNKIVFYGLIFAQLGAVIWISAGISRLSASAANTLFLLYAALTGMTLSVIFAIYTGESIVSVFAMTAISFMGLSSFGYITKRDLGPIGSFCMMGLFGLVGYGLVSLFFPAMMSGTAERVYSLVGLIVFAGLTAYDTQKIKELAYAHDGPSESLHKIAVLGALTLYLDFVNLFLKLLSFFGKRRN